MISRRRLVAFVLVISSVILLAVFDGLLRSLSLFCCPHFLEASRCFCRPSLKLLAIFVNCVFAVCVGHLGSFSLLLLIVFSLFLSVISEASRYFVGCLFAVAIGHLGSFSSAVLEAFCCFCRSSWKLLAVFVGCLGSILLFLSAITEVSRCFRQPSWKLQFAVLAVL